MIAIIMRFLDFQLLINLSFNCDLVFKIDLKPFFTLKALIENEAENDKGYNFGKPETFYTHSHSKDKQGGERYKHSPES